MGRATRVLLIGGDSIHRAQVLRSVGYIVDECAGIGEMLVWFRAGGDADLVCINEGPGCAAEGAIAVARTRSKAPLVLFRDNYHHYFQNDCDLDVQTLTGPQVWLGQIADLLS